MAKRKKKSKLSARAVWSLLIAYVVAGVVVAILYLNRNAPGSEDVDAVQQGLSNAWGLFPIVVILWPIFLIVLLVQAFL